MDMERDNFSEIPPYFPSTCRKYTNFKGGPSK